MVPMTTMLTFNEFCEETGIDHEDVCADDAYVAFVTETADDSQFSDWWAENQGRFV